MSSTDRGGFGLFSDPRQLRNRWFADLSQAMDGYLRSPAFLEWMRCTLSVLAEAQALQAACLTNLLSGHGYAALSTSATNQGVSAHDTDSAEPNRTR